MFIISYSFLCFYYCTNFYQANYLPLGAPLITIVCFAVTHFLPAVHAYVILFTETISSTIVVNYRPVVNEGKKWALIDYHRLFGSQPPPGILQL